MTALTLRDAHMQSLFLHCDACPTRLGDAPQQRGAERSPARLAGAARPSTSMGAPPGSGVAAPTDTRHACPSAPGRNAPPGFAAPTPGGGQRRALAESPSSWWQVAARALPASGATQQKRSQAPARGNASIRGLLEKALYPGPYEIRELGASTLANLPVASRCRVAWHKRGHQDEGHKRIITANTNAFCAPLRQVRRRVPCLFNSSPRQFAVLVCCGRCTHDADPIHGHADPK